MLKELSSFNQAVSMRSLPSREAVAEANYAFEISSKVNYGEAFTRTPKEITSSIVRLFAGWFAKLGVDEKLDFALLDNNDFFTEKYVSYICGKNANVQQFERAQPTLFASEIRLFLAMKCFDRKIEMAWEGHRAFFSEGGKLFAAFRAIATKGRSYIHEAIGHEAKHGHISDAESVELSIEEVLSSLFNKCVGSIIAAPLASQRAIQDEAINPASTLVMLNNPEIEDHVEKPA
jgi:hypothetical protein